MQAYQSTIFDFKFCFECDWVEIEKGHFPNCYGLFTILDMGETRQDACSHTVLEWRNGLLFDTISFVSSFFSKKKVNLHIILTYLFIQFFGKYRHNLCLVQSISNFVFALKAVEISICVYLILKLKPKISKVR